MRVARVGKFLDLELDRDRVVVNPMLTGRFQLAGRGEKPPTGVAVEVWFGTASAGTPPDAAAWTAGADVAAGRRRPRRGPLSGSDADGQGLPAARTASTDRVPGRGRRRDGPRRHWIPALTLDVFRERIRRHPGELKNLLRNQAFVAGIGNAYTDEILFAARLQPFRKRSSLAAEEIDELYAAMRSTLAACDPAAPRARPAHVREAGPRPPRGPQQGRRALPAVRRDGSPRSRPAASRRATAGSCQR